MTAEDPTADNGPLPATGMATASDDGEPGEHLPEPELDAEERALLQRLLQPDPDPAEGAENAQ